MLSDLIYMWNLKKTVTTKLIEKEIRFVVTRDREWGGEIG